ncbi:MAG: hypothetical protein QXP91_12300 [Candidatus Methanomethylicia archaeon]
MRVRAVLLYGWPSYREVTYVLRVISCSYEAVRLWLEAGMRDC